MMQSVSEQFNYDSFDFFSMNPGVFSFLSGASRNSLTAVKTDSWILIITIHDVFGRREEIFGQANSHKILCVLQSRDIFFC